MLQVVTTDAVIPRKRVAFWQEMVSQTFVQAHCDSKLGKAFRGGISTEVFATTEISRIEATQQRIDRRRSDIARACKPRFYLCYHACGHARYSDYRNGQVQTLLGPGDMILLDNCEPYAGEYEERVVSFVLQVPHELLRDRFRLPERVVGRKLDAKRGINRFAGDFLRSSLTQSDVLVAAHRPMIANMALNLFAGVLAEEAGEQTQDGTHQAILVMRIKQHILSRLGEPSLNLERVAGSMGLSVRYVSRLFQNDGLSFGRYLLQQRIERCRQDLANPLLRGRRISEIALRNGFNNLAHFSRVYRAAVGSSPSEFRSQIRGDENAAIGRGSQWP